MNPTWAPGTCPMADPAARGACKNAGMRCLSCMWPDETIAPTEYLPVAPHHLHPVVQARQDARRRARQTAKRSDASKRGRANKRKGSVFEREVARVTGGHTQPGSGAFRGALSNDVIGGDHLGAIQIEAKYGSSYPTATLYDWLAKGDLWFVAGQRTAFVLTTLARWDVRQWDGLAVRCVTSKRVGTWETFLLDEAEKPEVVITRRPRGERLVLQLIPHWIRHMGGAQSVPVDLAKVAEARRLLEEAISG